MTLPQRTWYVTSPRKGNTLATVAHFFGPVGSAASGAVEILESSHAPRSSSSAVLAGAVRSSPVANTSPGSVKDVGHVLPTEGVSVGQKRQKGDGLQTSGLRKGATRKCYNIFYRYSVVLKFTEFKEKGDKSPLNHSGRNWPNPGCSFYLSVSMSRKPPVVYSGC